jgi:hypothetical protein
MRAATIAALWMLAVSTASAQWATNWPGGYFQSRSRMTQLNSALVERLEAVVYMSAYDTNTVAPDVKHFNEWSLLVTNKAIAKLMLDRHYFYDIAQTNSAGAFDPTGVLEDFPYLYATSAIARAGLPTNFWEYTPFFTCAFNTNYGYPAMKSVLNQMVLTDGVLNSGARRSYVTQVLTNTFSISTNDWTYAKDSAVAFYTNVNNWASTNIALTNYQARTPFARIVDYEFATIFIHPDDDNTYRQSYNRNGHDEIDMPVTNMWSEAWAFTQVGGRSQGTSFFKFTNYWSGADQHRSVYFYEKLAATNSLNRQYTDFPIEG